MAVARRLMLTLALAGFVLGLSGGREPGRADAQAPAPAPGPTRAPAPPPVHGTPKDWRFSWPKGDPAKGRGVFQRLECYSCHEVRGERFPTPTDRARVGPELSAMGPLHPPEYFAEAIINPNASVGWRIKHHKEEKKGYLGTDGKSRMPSYNGALTVQQLIDVVAYLKSLTAPPEHKH